MFRGSRASTRYRAGAVVVAALAVLVPTATAGASGGPSWVLQQPVLSPPITAEGAMAFDPILGETVLFGGSPGTGSTTWGWNGTTWAVLATSGPAPRKDMQMAYDAASASIVMFGGIGTGAYGHGFSDTWTFDGSWHKQSPRNVPSTILGYAMAYDAANQTVVMAGGERNSLSGATWVWDGVDWHRNASVPYPTSAPGLNYATMAYDPTTQAVVLFGGITGVVGQRTTWTWTGNSWTELQPTTSPPVRRAAVSAYDAALGGVVVFGGYGGVVRGTTVLGDTWLFNGSNWSRLKVGMSTPPPRGDGQLASDQAGSLILFGGTTTGGAVADTWKL